MPSRSSTTPSISAPSRSSKACCAALAIYGWAIRQKATLESLPTRHLKTARAYQIRLAFQDLYDQSSAGTAAGFLKTWYIRATHSRLEPVIDAAHTVKRHCDGILRWFHSKIANGLVQAARSKARGYRSIRNLEAMAYLLAGKRDLRLPA
jgi:transposase